MKKMLCLILLAASARFSYSQNTGMYFLSPGADVNVPVVGKITIKVRQFNMESNPNIQSAKWTINGNSLSQANPADGNLSSNFDLVSATYTAPQKVPSKNPVAVSIAFKLSDTSKMVLFLTCNITVTEVENYMNVSTPYCTDYLEFVQPKNEFAKQQMSMTNYINGLLHINIYGNWVKDPSIVLSMALIVDGNKPGTYKWKYPEAKVIANLDCSNYKGNPITLASTDCVPNHKKDCKAISLEGSTTITTYDTQKKIIQGYFSGGVLGVLHNQFYYGSVYGRFTCHLK